MTALDALDLAHAELIAATSPKLAARRVEARNDRGPITAQKLRELEMYAAGIDHAMRVARQHLARLEHGTSPPVNQEPLEFETRHA